VNYLSLSGATVAHYDGLNCVREL